MAWHVASPGRLSGTADEPVEPLHAVADGQTITACGTPLDALANFPSLAFDPSSALVCPDCRALVSTLA